MRWFVMWGGGRSSWNLILNCCMAKSSKDFYGSKKSTFDPFEPQFDESYWWSAQLLAPQCGGPGGLRGPQKPLKGITTFICKN